MNKTYSLEDTLKIGRSKPVTVKTIIENDRKKIIELIKQGYDFDEEVMKAARITRTVRDVKTYNEVAHHEKDTKVYAKETASLKTVFKSILTNDFADTDTVENVNPNNDLLCDEDD